MDSERSPTTKPEQARAAVGTRAQGGAKINPEQAGVPLYGTRRRVPGLRREEVAQLAGLSTDYYTRLEKGNLRSASDSVLEAISRALHLDDAEHAHLLDLARAARDGARPVRRRAPPSRSAPACSTCSTP